MAELAVPDWTVKVFCDDAGHARGKVANVATFGRFNSPSGEMRWGILRPEHRAFSTTAWKDSASTTAHRRYGAGDECEKGSTYGWPCDLCAKTRRGQAPLELTEVTLPLLLDWIGQNRAQLEKAGVLKTERRVSRISLKHLNLIASKRPQQQ